MSEGPRKQPCEMKLLLGRIATGDVVRGCKEGGDNPYTP